MGIQTGNSRKDAEAIFSAAMDARRMDDYRRALEARGYSGERLERAMAQAVSL